MTDTPGADPARSPSGNESVRPVPRLLSWRGAAAAVALVLVSTSAWSLTRSDNTDTATGGRPDLDGASQVVDTRQRPSADEVTVVRLLAGQADLSDVQSVVASRLGPGAEGELTGKWRQVAELFVQYADQIRRNHAEGAEAAQTVLDVWLKRGWITAQQSTGLSLQTTGAHLSPSLVHRLKTADSQLTVLEIAAKALRAYEDRFLNHSGVLHLAFHDVAAEEPGAPSNTGHRREVDLQNLDVKGLVDLSRDRASTGLRLADGTLDDLGLLGTGNGDSLWINPEATNAASSHARQEGAAALPRHGTTSSPAVKRIRVVAVENPGASRGRTTG